MGADGDSPLLEELEAMREADPDGFADLARAIRGASLRLKARPPVRRKSA